MATWRNWAGGVTASPQRIERPRTEAELTSLVAGAQTLRVAGTGHSFMPLVHTDDLLVDLSQMEGALEVAPDRQSAWVPAGWSVGRLGEELWREGLSLANQGDIDKQAIAGALSTATHGTGRALGSLSTFARAYRLVLADGSVVECDAGRDADLFEAQRVSLGMLGVITRVRLATPPAFHLRETIRREPLAKILEEWEALAAGHRHVEFFVFPYCDQAMLKILDPVEAGDDPAPVEPAAAFQALCDLVRLVPPLAGPVQRLMMSTISASERAAPAYRIFPSERSTLFEEMEYEIPAQNGPDALKAAIAEVRRRRLPIVFPFEFRTVAADDIWLSPMSGQDCVSISFHQYAAMPWREAFAAIEAVFRAAGGRPHWAKRHNLASRDVEALYPAAPRWADVRRRVDPKAKFLNHHLRDLFGFSL